MTQSYKWICLAWFYKDYSLIIHLSNMKSGYNTFIKKNKIFKLKCIILPKKYIIILFETDDIAKPQNKK